MLKFLTFILVFKKKDVILPHQLRNYKSQKTLVR